MKFNLAINIILIIAFVGIGILCSLGVNSLFTHPPFSNTLGEKLISIGTGAFISAVLIIAKIKYFKI